MSQSIIPFIFMFVAMAVIAFSLILYVYRRGKSSKGVYIAKALEFIAKKYPSIDTSNIKCVEFWSSMGIMGNADVALVAYNDDDMYMMSVIPRSIPGFYRIVPNEESEWDMFYYPMSSIEQAGFDEKQKNFIFTVNGRSIKLKIRKRNGFQEDQQAELHDFFTTISQALQKNKALNV
jgi:hypothetical protein